jgi:hypothetical protein
MVVVVKQADHQAVNYGENTEDQDLWMTVADAALLTFYIFELSVRFYVDRLHFFWNAFNVLDFAVVMNDLILGTVSWLLSIDTPGWLSFLRILRLARLLRTYRILLFFPMLASMCRDLVGAMQAVVWGCVLLLFVVTGWSIVAVQVVHPLTKDLVAGGVYDGCERCPRAFSTVMNANLTFLQQVIAGDNWGQGTIPIIEAHPWTAVLFVSVLVSIQLAIMNVILALIVESAEAARKDDIVHTQELQERAFLKKSKKLLSLCEGLDLDASADLTLDELLAGFESNADLVAILKDMGINRSDITIAFEIMDEDGSGCVSYEEFVHYVYRMKTTDVHTSLNFIRHFVLETLRLVRTSVSNEQQLKEDLRTCSEQIARDSLRISSVVPTEAVNSEVPVSVPVEATSTTATSAGDVDTPSMESLVTKSQAWYSKASEAFEAAEAVTLHKDHRLEEGIEELRSLSRKVLQRVENEVLNMSKQFHEELLLLTANVAQLSKSIKEAKLLDSSPVIPSSVTGREDSGQVSCAEALSFRACGGNASGRFNQARLLDSFPVIPASVTGREDSSQVLCAEALSFRSCTPNASSRRV